LALGAGLVHVCQERVEGVVVEEVIDEHAADVLRGEIGRVGHVCEFVL